MCVLVRRVAGPFGVPPLPPLSRFGGRGRAGSARGGRCRKVVMFGKWGRARRERAQAAEIVALRDVWQRGGLWPIGTPGTGPVTGQGDPRHFAMLCLPCHAGKAGTWGGQPVTREAASWEFCRGCGRIW